MTTTRTAIAALVATVALAAGLSLATSASAADGASVASPTNTIYPTIGVTVPTATGTPTPTATPSKTPTPTPSTTRRPSASPSPTSTAPAEPAIPDAPATTGAEAKTDDEMYRLGETVTVTSDGFTPGEQVQIVVFSEPLLIGNVAAGADGTFEHEFALPDELRAGQHTIQLTGWQSKRVAIVEILVSTSPSVRDTRDNAEAVVSNILWWAAGLIVLLGLIGLGAWWVIRTLRVPAGAAT